MSVWVVDRVCGPSTCDVVEEESRHITWTMIVLTTPFVVITNGEPVFQFSRHFGSEVVAIHHILAMANEAMLVEQRAAEIIVHIL